MQFGSLRSHKYIDIVFWTHKLHYESDAVWKEHVPFPLFPAISKL